jgi:hypothetical protein
VEGRENSRMATDISMLKKIMNQGNSTVKLIIAYPILMHISQNWIEK